LERSAELVGAKPLHLLTQTALPLKSPTGAFIAALRSANAVAPNAKYQIILPLNMASNDDDRRQRRKQGGVVGAAASKTRVPPKARCGCWVPQPDSGSHSKSFICSTESCGLLTFSPQKVKNPAEKRSRWFKKQFGCVILETKVSAGRGNRRARLRVPCGTNLSPGGRKARGKNCSDRKPEGRSGQNHHRRQSFVLRSGIGQKGAYRRLRPAGQHHHRLWHPKAQCGGGHL